jgi:hypothetical protein
LRSDVAKWSGTPRRADRDLVKRLKTAIDKLTADRDTAVGRAALLRNHLSHFGKGARGRKWEERRRPSPFSRAIDPCHGNTARSTANELSPKTDEIDILNGAGDEVWRLVVITVNNIAYLKRQLEDPTPALDARSTRRKTATSVK